MTSSLQRVLVVSKRTNFEKHLKEVNATVYHGKLNPDYLQSMRMSHDQHFHCLDELLRELKNAGFDPIFRFRDEIWPANKDFDIVISVGGDGTMLSASHALSADHVLLGIRSSEESVGFLCGSQYYQIRQTVDSLRTGSLRIDFWGRMRPLVERLREGKAEVLPDALNDILYCNLHPSGTTRYILKFKDCQEFQKSSGVWMATAVGSTAAIKAAGGKVQSRDDQRFQFKVREPYSIGDTAYKLESGFFDESTSFLSIESLDEFALLAIDGTRTQVQLGFGDRVHFQRGQNIRVASLSSGT